MYAVIMAGGSGTRLWPKSRKDKPKQFHNLISSHTMLQETIERIKPIIPLKNILIVAGKSHLKSIREQLPEIPSQNLFLEPVAKNTAPAIGFAAMALSKIDPDATAAFLSADHFIAKKEEFSKILKISEEIANKENTTVTIGINPTYPETGYGYIQLGKEFKEIDGHNVFYVKEFKEKPDIKTAQKYVASWQYLWNSGMFIWKIKTLLDLFSKHQPKLYKQLQKIKNAIGQKNQDQLIKAEYDKIDEDSIDYAILEKTKKIIVVPADIGWSDVGSWSSLKDVLSFGSNQNVVAGRHLGIDTTNCLIQGGSRLIATIGLDNFVIVDTDDVLLVCPKNKSQDVKKIIEKIKEEGKKEYL
jgi:mannose-1-phosphate guanylyltransferase